MGLFDIFSSSDAQDAANAQIRGIQQGVSQAQPYLTNGVNALNNYYGMATSPLSSVFSGASPAISSYADAIGANGAAGNARAVAAFQNNPGYQFQLNQGLQAIDRGAASRGMLTSGNTLNAEQQYGTNLANTSWQNYLNSFSPMLSLAGGAAGGLASTFANQGNQNLAANQSNAQLLYGANTAQGQAKADADYANLNASANMWNALGNIGVSAAKIFSDRDVKRPAPGDDKIKPVGKLNDGTNVYRFAYKSDPPGMTRIGLIAQEVEKRDRSAVSKIGGVRAVDMKRATDKAAKRGRSSMSDFARAA